MLFENSFNRSTVNPKEENMATLLITTVDGETKTIEAPDGTNMMEALRDAGLVEGTCGGVASCGTCHVYFPDKAVAGETGEDEGYMLEGLADFVEIRDGSRLSCQVKVAALHDSMKIEIAPEA